jgi:hypothetical protein
MDTTGFLTPVIALIVWTLMVWIIMYVRRIPAMQAAKIAPDTAKSPDGDWKSKLPMNVQAAAHNYNHLMEQPTIFYAFMFWALLTGVGTAFIGLLAWIYVGLRVVHSVIQISAGPVMLRFGVFSLSTLCLIGMVVLALLA